MYSNENQSQEFKRSIVNLISFIGNLSLLYWAYDVFRKKEYFFFGIILFFSLLWILINPSVSSKIRIFWSFLKKQYKIVCLLFSCSFFLIVLLMLVMIMYPIFVSNMKNVNSNLLANQYFYFSPADLSSSYYLKNPYSAIKTDSIGSDDVAHTYNIPEYGNKNFKSHYSYLGQEKWFVYARLRETNLLSKKVANTELINSNGELRLPFMGYLRRWKEDASNLGISIEKVDLPHVLPNPGDVLIWDTKTDSNNLILKFGHLAFVEKVINGKIYISESRMVIQDKCTDTPKLPDGIKKILICEDPQFIEINDGTKIRVFGVTLYENPTINSLEICDLNRFQVLHVLKGPKVSNELCWIRKDVIAQDGFKSNCLIRELKKRNWYYVSGSINNKDHEGWVRLEDRSQPSEEYMSMHSIEHNFTGIGIYGHESSMYDVNDASIIRFGKAEVKSDFYECE